MPNTLKAHDSPAQEPRYPAQVAANVLTVAIILRAILSWFPLGPDNPLSVLLFRLTEPLLGPLRRRLPMMGTMDLTPLIAILLLRVAVNLLGYLLLRWG